MSFQDATPRSQEVKERLARLDVDFNREVIYEALQRLEDKSRTDNDLRLVANGRIALSNLIHVLRLVKEEKL